MEYVANGGIIMEKKEKKEIEKERLKRIKEKYERFKPFEIKVWEEYKSVPNTLQNILQELKEIKKRLD